MEPSLTVPPSNETSPTDIVTILSQMADSRKNPRVLGMH
jgi:hypothetical protein